MGAGPSVELLEAAVEPRRLSKSSVSAERVGVGFLRFLFTPPGALAAVCFGPCAESTSCSCPIASSSSRDVFGFLLVRCLAPGFLSGPLLLGAGS